MAKSKLSLTDDEWRDKLSIHEYLVLRKKVTEKKGKGEYNKFQPKNGYFVCRGCGNPLYSWRAKYEAMCGWPTFDKCFKNSIYTQIDDKYVKIEKYINRNNIDKDAQRDLLRLEILCFKCDGHLGHIFPHQIEWNHNVNRNRTNQRHCVNSRAIKYVNKQTPDNLTESILNISALYKDHNNIDIDSVDVKGSKSCAII